MLGKHWRGPGATAFEFEELQRGYYERTAAQYDHWHVGEETQHDVALNFISGFVNLFQYSSVLDVGAGTGRAVSSLTTRHPGLHVRGVEPVPALIDEAVRKGVRKELLVGARGEKLPFKDGSFDVVCETGTLHHVSEPRRVVQEMMRVARRAIFLSDNNRFGHGHLLSRVGKLTLHKLRLWDLAYLIKTRGKGYMVSDEDGVFQSYSVYDSFGALATWAERIFLVPTGRHDRASWLHPLITSYHVLLCAMKDSEFSFGSYAAGD